MDVKKDIVFRLSTIYVIAAIIAFAIIIRIFVLQFVQNKEYEETEEKVQYKTEKTTPERGDICAWDGKILATSQPFYEIRMDLASEALKKDTFDRYAPALADSLSKLFPEKTREAHYSDLMAARLRKDRFYLIKKEVTHIEYNRLCTFPIFNKGQFKGGFIALKRSKRVLPYNELASRSIGSLKNDKYIGIEGYFNAELQGEERIKLLKKISQNWIPIAQDETFHALSGKDIITTIDINFQDFAHHALLEQLQNLNADTGIVILMEVKTGEIKAIVNLMRNSVGEYIEGYNHAIGSAIEPGSTFKLASLMVALEDGYIDLNDSIQTGNGYVKIHGFPIREASGHGYGKLSVQEVLEKSSNVGTSMLVYNYYKDNPKKFVNRLYSMELDKKVDIEIKGEPLPSIKYPGDPLWSGVSLPQMSIGYELLLTPLQMLNFYNTVANDGVMVKPRLIKAIREHGAIIKEYNTQIINPSICSKTTIEKAKLMLEGVVDHGTARNIKGAPYKIAGKTGTAQVASGSSGYDDNEGNVKAHFGSFAGYFPADNPQYSCIVVVKTKDKHNFYGNIVAAPVFRKIADKVYASSPNMRKEIPSSPESGLALKDVPYSKNGNIKDLDLIYNQLRIPVKGRDKVRSAWIVTREKEKMIEYQNRIIRRNQVPMVVGMGLKDAIYLLESVGLRVLVNGRGTIKEQSIEAGQQVRRNQTIVLKLG
jgi:cell division protein FtsI (penicillin-binding protein 3)